MFAKKEWDTLREVVMHRPGTEIDYAMISPRAFLFERPFNKNVALKEHENLQKVLEENGVKVNLLREISNDLATRDHSFREKMEKKVLDEIQFYGDLSEAQKGKNELKKNLPYMDPDTLFNIMILCPSIDIRVDDELHMYYPKIFSNIPLTNLYFMRDQQAVTSEGVIGGRMRLPQRNKEPDLTNFIWTHKLRKENTFRVGEETSFEGGDYIPMGEFGLIGTGPRTSKEGAMSALNSGLMKHDEVFLVENPKYEFQVKDLLNNMHLDTYFNIASESVAIGSEILMKKAVGTTMVRNDDKFSPSETTTLYEYIKAKGFSILNIDPLEQLCYSSNFLTLSNSKIVCIDSYAVFKKLLKNGVMSKELVDQIGVDKSGLEERMFPNKNRMNEFGVDYIEINLEEITGGYGGAHCMTMSLSR